MGTYVGPAPVTRTRWIAAGLIAALVVGALALGIVLAIRVISLDGPSTDRSQGAIVQTDPGMGEAYPAHHGLAGPSTVGTDPRGGYPAHGGLAGPSQLQVDPRGAYPAHGGLAGPSGAGAPTGHPGYGTGYPQHGGLAGPSGAGGDR